MQIRFKRFNWQKTMIMLTALLCAVFLAMPVVAGQGTSAETPSTSSAALEKANHKALGSEMDSAAIPVVDEKSQPQAVDTNTKINEAKNDKVKNLKAMIASSVQADKNGQLMAQRWNQEIKALTAPCATQVSLKRTALTAADKAPGAAMKNSPDDMTVAAALNPLATRADFSSMQM